MELISLKTIQILPNLEATTLDLLLKVLEDIGVVADEDLKYVQESDMIPTIRPIQARKLIAAWKELDPVPNTPCQPEAVTSSANQLNLNPSSNPIVNPPNIPSDWADTFQIPWENMSSDVLKCLEEGRRPAPRYRRELINETARTIHKICEKPGKKNLQKIARKAIEKYSALSDVWCDDIIAGGCESLTRSLVVKFENLNRKDVFNTVKRDLKRKEVEDCDKDAKLSNSSMYGCLNWQPKVLPVGESRDSQVEKQTEMLKIAATNKAEDLSDETLVLLKDTYVSQREDINRLKNITFLHKSWPLLFSTKGFFQHFNILTGINLIDMMENSIQTKVVKVINFFKSLPNKKNKTKDILEKYNKNDVSDLKVAVSLLLDYFNEKSEEVLISTDSSLTTKDVENLTTLPNTPCLISSGEDSIAVSYMVAVDRKIINEDIKNFETGVFMVFAAYYILNIEYAEMASATLEFIQRCFLKMNPDRGSKVSKTKKKKTVMNPKVLTLLNKLMDFEWC